MGGLQSSGKAGLGKTAVTVGSALVRRNRGRASNLQV
jgi:hypothetical protein